MTSPINPQEQSLSGFKPDRWMTGDGEFVSVFDAWRASALEESIHQTFKRDAFNQKAALEDEQAGDPPRDWIPDPATEIDRLARLICDGEYRRRLSQQTEGE